MPNETPDQPTGGTTESAAPVDPQPTPSREPAKTQSQPARWLAPVSLLIAVLAAGVAVWALISARDAGSPSASGNPEGGSKARVCDAFGTISRAVVLQTNNNLGPDPVAEAAVAANARLALFGSGVYLMDTVGSDTPSDLADPVRSFASDLQTIGIVALAGVTNDEPAQAKRLTDADATRQQIAELCK